MFVCIFLGLTLASGRAIDAKWPDPQTGWDPAFPPDMPDKFARSTSGSWQQMYKTKEIACSYPGPDLPGADCDFAEGDKVWLMNIDCGFANLHYPIGGGSPDLPALYDPNPVGKKPRISVLGVQAINGLNLGIRYAHFCSKESSSLYQAAYVSPHFFADPSDQTFMHHLDSVPLQQFLNDARFDTVGSAAERKAYVAGMRHLGLVDDGELVDMEWSEEAATCHQAPYGNGPAVCSAEMPDDYSCEVATFTPATSTGCGRGRNMPCPAICEDQDLYHKQCQKRTCPCHDLSPHFCDSNCCVATGGAEKVWSIKGPWHAMNEHPDSEVVV